MNRAALTEELIRIKSESTQKTEDIIKLKTSLHKWKIYVPLTGIALSLVAVLGGHVVENNFNSLKQELKVKTEYADSFMAKAKQLELNLKYTYENSSLVYVSKEDLLDDLMKNYPEVSTKVKITILETILSESEKYNMNPLILYSLVFVESSFRHWLEHTPTMIDKGGKKIRISAVGLCGVVWEIHKDDLKQSGIAENRGDLFFPDTNIKAGAFILDKYIQMEKVRGAKTQTESGLLRYYGGNYTSYTDRIKAKIFDLTKENYFK